jgi:hypothetical protein
LFFLFVVVFIVVLFLVFVFVSGWLDGWADGVARRLDPLVQAERARESERVGRERERERHASWACLWAR